jgi:hypothetical protein
VVTSLPVGACALHASYHPRHTRLAIAVRTEEEPVLIDLHALAHSSTDTDMEHHHADHVQMMETSSTSSSSTLPPFCTAISALSALPEDVRSVEPGQWRFLSLPPVMARVASPLIIVACAACVCVLLCCVRFPCCVCRQRRRC